MLRIKPVLFCLWTAVAMQPVSAWAESADDAAVRDRLKRAVEWLAAPEREGRGPGTKGIEQAADWVAGQFAEIGLRTVAGGGETAGAGQVAVGGSFQRFGMTLDAKLGPPAMNTAELVGPPGEDGRPRTIPLALGKDFTPLAAGGSGGFDLPLVFAGYGITAPAEHYDDYAPLGHAAAGGPVGTGVKGAAAIVIRQEPQKDDPHSVFDGNQASQHAALARKVANASEHEAGGVVFCNDADADGDTLMAFTRAGDGSEKRSLPILQIRRSLIDEVVQASLGRKLDAIQKAIDDTLEPQSGPLACWRIRGQTAIERSETEGRNVIAMLPGTGRPRDGAADAQGGLG
ncbi:MAG: hypothetical protein ACKO6B_17970, partial [Planctomycetia bacterium]